MNIYLGCILVCCCMYCFFGYKVDEFGCDICECDYFVLLFSGLN